MTRELGGGVFKRNRTKNEIYQAAKKLFREKGYNKTIIKDIAERAESSLGAFTYHYSSKEALLTEIFREYNDSIDKALADKDWFINDTKVFKHIAASIIYYNNIFKDEACKRFYVELLEKDLNSGFNFNFIYNKYSTFFEEYGKKISPTALQAKIFQDFGARRELLLNFVNNKIMIDYEEMCRYLLEMMLNIFLIDTLETERIFEKAYSKIDKFDYDFITLI